MSKKVILTDLNETSKIFFEEIRRYEVLSKAREHELFIEYYLDSTSSKRKNEIRDLIICSNLRWCFSKSKTFKSAGSSQADLFSSAYEGMIESFDKFDYTKNVKFATFATFYIQNSLNSFIYGQSKTISDTTTNKVVDKKLSRVISELEQELKYNPSSQEIIERYNIGRGNSPLLTEDTLSSRKMFKNTLPSIDAPYSDDEGDMVESMSDRLDFGYVPADNLLINDEAENGINKLLSTLLKEREVEVVKMKLGLNCPEYTNDIIADNLGLTRERVGQIFSIAMQKLKENKEIAIKILA